jgi:exodeoxyribonuclease VII small subunit
MNDLPGEPHLNPGGFSNDGDRTVSAVPSSSTVSEHHWSYESTVAEIEAIINRIEIGELELADVFQQFAIAINHLRQCENFLTHQRHQVDLLIETLTDEPEDF